MCEFCWDNHLTTPCTPGPPRGNWSSPFKVRRISVDSVNTSITIYFTEVVCRSLDRFCCVVAL